MTATPKGYRWVTCSVALDWSTARHRHLIAVGKKSDTTVCNTTGVGGAWRGDSRKPECPNCIARATWILGLFEATK